MNMRSEEHARLDEPPQGNVFHWQKWGPYVAERSWGTVREDYSSDGDAWSYFPFEQAHKQAYRWGEDGIAGWCDRYQFLVFAPAFWNERDPILKERFYGLNAWEGNHGEDVKEYYFYIDATPTHSYMKFLYKYPQAEFPYQKLKDENKKRKLADPEYELVDTGIFAENRYFDIFIEYAKASPEDICIRIEAINRGPEDAPLHILPHLWFRNQWSWTENPSQPPVIMPCPSSQDALCLVADDANLPSPSNLIFEYHIGQRYLYGPKGGKLLFTDNESTDGHLYVKDGIQEAVIHGAKTINPSQKCSKACFHYYFDNIPPQQSAVIHMRMTPSPKEHPLNDVDAVIQQRKAEADRFYDQIHPKQASEAERQIQRQALAGILWNRQIYLYDVNRWLEGDNPNKPPPESRLHIRNEHWRHLNSMRIITMPDKWEFPWFASWDLAFHAITLGLVDIDFAKYQISLLLRDQFQHPNGAIPSYEWNFSDLNPPLQAWAVYRIYMMEKRLRGRGDEEFLQTCFNKLMLNFVWWVNKVDSKGLNIFEGGFLGLDNIAITDRSNEFESGVTLKQSDSTGWMAMFSLYLMRISLELTKLGKKGFEDITTKFFEHFVYIAHAMKRVSSTHYELWSHKDGFFYDSLSYPNGTYSKFRVRSYVGIIPLFATEMITEEDLKYNPNFVQDLRWFLSNRKDLTDTCIFPYKEGYLLSLVNKEQLQSMLGYIWNSEEFHSEFGLRSLSKFHAKNPYNYKDWRVEYEPGVARSRIKGGNSNWRGPVWIQMTYLLIQTLEKLARVYPDKLSINAETRQEVDLKTISRAYSESLLKIFQPDQQGLRPFFGPNPLANDPFWSPYLLFHEYYNAETGKGLGASHQGWSTLIANLIDEKYSG